MTPPDNGPHRGSSPDNILERWLQPLSSLGLFLIALIGVLIGRPFVREYAAQSVAPATAKTQGFRTITAAMTWMWVGAFGGSREGLAAAQSDATTRVVNFLTSWVGAARVHR